MILGVSHRFLPPFLGIPETGARRGSLGLWAIAAGLLLESTLFVALRLTGDHRWAAGLYLGWILLAVGSVTVVWPWRLWRPPAQNNRSGRLIRLAYAWLGLSFLMLLLLPANQALSGTPFSHAYYGAIRHAVTVGFISQMIVGVSTLVVPLTPRTATLRPTLVLLNLGCFLRVSLQIWSDWTPAAFWVIGVSGVLELTALLLWAAVLWRGLLRPGSPACRGPCRCIGGETMIEKYRQDRPGLQLALSTAAFAACFAVFGSLSAMMPDVRRLLHLTDSQKWLAISLPVLLGSLGRIPLGILADRLGGRLIFAFTLVASIVPVVLLGLVTSYSMLLVCGFLVGIALASFAVGVSFVSPWYPASRQGYALGVYGAGNIGQAIASFGAPVVAGFLGYRWGFWAWGVLAAVVLVAWLLLARDAPDADRRRGGPTTSGPWPGRVPGLCRSSTS